MGRWSNGTAAVGWLTMLGMALGAGSAGAEPGGEGEFQPVKEAEMPPGFPGYTPVDQIEVKQYPAYRKAVVEGGSGFWTLFMHIKKNEVQMTAPVEMDFGDPSDRPSEMRSMAFLYERPDQGSVGRQGRVEVVDEPAKQFVSIGCRGLRNSSSVEAARQRLLAWLEEHKDKYVADGPMRIMGYNSPFIPRSKQFFEVQIPVASRPTGD